MRVIIANSYWKPTLAHGQEIKMHYATLVYNNVEYLRPFNDQVLLESSSCRISHHAALTVAEEAGCKLDVIVDRIEAALDMFPRSLNFRTILLPTSRDVLKPRERTSSRVRCNEPGIGGSMSRRCEVNSIRPTGCLLKHLILIRATYALKEKE
jgi:hypothetical protein